MSTKLCPRPNRKLFLSKRYKLEDHYEIVRQIGVGSFGSVKLANRKCDGTLVAIKISRGSTAIRMLKNESNILKKMESSHFLKFIELQEDCFNSKAYLVMEYFEGKTIDEYSEGISKTDDFNLINIILQLTEAINELHLNEICHRDIKPQNVMVNSQGELKLIDFGISSHFRKSTRNSNEEQNSRKFKSRFFTQISSPEYAAPEIISKDCYDESIDIWGIGIIWLIMFSKMSSGGLVLKYEESFLAYIQNARRVYKEVEDSNTKLQLSILNKILCENAADRPSIREIV